MVQHESQLIDLSNSLEHRDQFIFKAVSGYLSYEDFRSSLWRASLPVWWRSITPLSISLYDAVACLEEELCNGHLLLLDLVTEGGRRRRLLLQHTTEEACLIQ